MTVTHKSAKGGGAVCGAHWKKIAAKRKAPLYVETYWGFTTCRTCLRSRPKIEVKKPDVRVRQVYGAYWIAPRKGFNSQKEALDWIRSIKGKKNCKN